MKKLLQTFAFVTATAAAGGASASVTFFEADNFVGVPFTANGAVADFRAYDYNDRAMSMVVEGSAVEVCADINFSGNCQVFIPGEYPSLINQGWTHTISSVRPAGYGGYGNDRRGYQGGNPQWNRNRYDTRDQNRGHY